MRIALAHMRHAGTGGTERYLDLLAAFLAERGDEVTIVCRSHEEAPHPAVRFRVLRDFALGGAWRMWAFARALDGHVRASEYDLVFGLGKTWTHDVIRLGGGCQRTYLELAHEATLSGVDRLVGKGRLKHRLAVAIEERALAPGAYRAVVTNSDLVKRDVVRRHAVAPEAVEVIYNGVDLERFHPGQRAGAGGELRRTLGFGKDDVVVLFLGTGYGRKGLDLVLESFPELAARRPAAKLMVVGYDSARGRYEERARELGIADARFVGGRRDAEACYGAADLFVLPTRYDPFANATVEALASGLPVVTSDTNGGAELIEPGVQGAVVGISSGGAGELARELVAWCEPERLAAGAAAARALAERHGARSKLEATADLLGRAAAEKGGGAGGGAGPRRAAKIPDSG